MGARNGVHAIVSLWRLGSAPLFSRSSAILPVDSNSECKDDRRQIPDLPVPMPWIESVSTQSTWDSFYFLVWTLADPERDGNILVEFHKEVASCRRTTGLSPWLVDVCGWLEDRWPQPITLQEAVKIKTGKKDLDEIFSESQWQS